jgi:hypothetical protein
VVLHDHRPADGQRKIIDGQLEPHDDNLRFSTYV